MHEILVNQSDSSVLVILKGQLSIQNGGAIRDAFLNALDQGNKIIINHENAEDFDLTYLQLIFSLHKTAMESGKDFQISCKHPESFIALIKDSGFLPYNWLGLENENLGGNING